MNGLLPAVVQHVRQAGPDKGVNVDALAGRVTMDAISLAIFGKTMGCTEELSKECKPRLAELTDKGECFLEVLQNQIVQWRLPGVMITESVRGKSWAKARRRALLQNWQALKEARKEQFEARPS